MRGVLNRSLDRVRLDALNWDVSALEMLRAAVDRSALTGRGWDRLRRVSSTIADLEGADSIGDHHVAEALSLRVDL